jgi:hypothetical protein
MAGAKSTDTSIAEHRETYANFVRLTIAAVIVCAISLVALMAMTLIGGVALWVGLVGLVAGHVVVAVTLASRLTWTPSLLVLAAIIVLSVLTL